MWFPYPSSWLRCLVLALWMSIVLRIGLFWGIFGVAAFGVSKPPERVLWSVGLALTASSVLFSYTHHFLWGKSPARYPKWLPSPKSLWEGLYAAIVMAVAITIGFGCVLPFHDSGFYQISELEAKWVAIVWAIVAAYFYQIEYLMRRKSRS